MSNYRYTLRVSFPGQSDDTTAAVCDVLHRTKPDSNGFDFASGRTTLSFVYRSSEWLTKAIKHLRRAAGPGSDRLVGVMAAVTGDALDSPFLARAYSRGGVPVQRVKLIKRPVGRPTRRVA